MTFKGDSKYGCALCGKSIQVANLVSFSKNRVKHVRRPNLHTYHLVVDGTGIKVKLCTSCKRMVRKSEKANVVKAN